MFPQEELRHFETKVEKHNHYREQLELSHQKLQHVEALGDKEHIRKTQDKYHTLAEKTKEIGYKVGAAPGGSVVSLQSALPNRKNQLKKGIFESSLYEVLKSPIFVAAKFYS